MDRFEEFREPTLFDGPEREASPDSETELLPMAWELGDHEVLLPDLFKVWWIGSERSMARYVWAILGRRGLLAGTTEIDRANNLLTLVTFAALHPEFCARAGEGTSGDWRFRSWDVVGEYPRVGPLTLGRLAQLSSLGDAGGWDVENRRRALSTISLR